jgi:hypothetical protein
MSLKFNIDRPKIGDDEIRKQQNFKELVEKFKQQSLKQAQGDETWWKDKKIRYTTVIAGITVICTITYLSLFNNQKQSAKKHETLTTHEKTSGTTARRFITEPSKKLAIRSSSYAVNNTNGGTITHGTSSKIKIPKNSFVDKNGKDIVGDVTIEYREFHDMGDIIASGIPMHYDSAGHPFNLESAGMFEIKGTKDGQPVFIKPEKTLRVELASATKEDRFNQYYLDTVAGNWEYLKRDNSIASMNRERSQSAGIKPQPAPNSKLETLKNEFEKIIPRKIDSVKTVYTTRTNRLPQTKEPAKPVKQTPGRPTFKLDGSYDEFPELAAFDNILFEVGPENNNYSKELHEITWSDVKVSQGPVKGKNYLLTLSYRNRNEKLVVYPVLKAENFDKAQKNYEEKLENYQALIAKRQAEEKRLLAEMEAKQTAYVSEQKRKQNEYETEKARMLAKYNVAEERELASDFNDMRIDVKASRIFSVSRFGVFNSDCPQPLPEGTSVNPVFMLQEKGQVVFPDLIYLVDHRNRTVYGITKQQGFKLKYDRESVYSLCVFHKNKMYVCGKEAFKNTVDEQSNRFVITPLPGDADNLPGLKKALEI